MTILVLCSLTHCVAARTRIALTIRRNKMGRPLNKRYFGNLNTNDSGQTKDTLVRSNSVGIGGQGVVSVNFSNYGSFAGNGSVVPILGLSLPAPTLPGGVQATGTVTFEVAAVTTGAGKTGLVVGDTYTYAGIGSPVITVATVSGSNATFTVTNPGTGFSTLPQDTIGVNITKVSGSGVSTFLVDISFKVKSFTIVDAGSGYVGSETFTVTLNTGASGTVPVGALVLTTDDGTPYDPEAFPAIIAYAYTVANNQIADIVKQKGNNGYYVKTAEGNAVCYLTDATASAVGEMTINATDSAGGTYWVTKLTAHKATLVPNTGSQFTANTAVQWTMSAPTVNETVKLDNA